MVQKYSLDEISEISKKFKGELNNEVSSYLMEIKKHHSFTIRRAPIKLKYSIMKDWKANNKSEEKISDRDRIYGDFISLLNKISRENYDSIEKSIYDIVNQNENTDNLLILIDCIFDKSMEDSFYSHLYIKILKGLNISHEIKIIINDKCSELFTQFNKNEIINSNINNVNYKELCNIVEKKDKYLAFFQLISFLYLNLLIELKIIKFYRELLIKEIENNTDNNIISIYIEGIIIFFNCLGEHIFNNDTDYFNNEFYKSVLDLSKDKIKLNSKNRFKLMDSLDKISYL